MKDYSRKEPSFSLCGLNCALCPRFHTEGPSRCLGCGGSDFSLKHPTCAVVSCNKKHDFVEFCFECSAYPCKRYTQPNLLDSFISYKMVGQHMAEAEGDLFQYLKKLKRKQQILEDLIINFNEGKSKGFYCLAVNLLPLSDLEEIVLVIKSSEGISQMSRAELVKKAKSLITLKAQASQIDLTLRK
jgi:hypothetical protein